MARFARLRLDIPRRLRIINAFKFIVQASQILRASMTNIVLLALLAVLSFNASATQYLSYDEDWYHDCAEKVAQESKSKDSLRTRLDVCLYKAIPKICRSNALMTESAQTETTNGTLVPDPKTGMFAYIWAETEREKEMKARSACIKRCMSASFLSRKFGECSKG